MRKLSQIILFFFLCSIFISFPEIRNVKAIGTVYIRSDGSTEGAGLKFSDEVYWFTGDIYGQIVIEKDGVTVDGSGYLLHAMNEGGILLLNRSGVALRNIEIVDSPFGVKIVDGRNNEVRLSNCSINLENTTGNSIYLNKKISLLFSNSSKNIVTENNVTGSPVYGIKLQKFSSENIICSNNITDNTSGVEFHGNSCNNTVYENHVDNNADGMIFYYDSNNNTVYNNTIAFNSNSGIFFRGSSNNRFFRNDIVQNEQQTICWYCTNIWDNGRQGNYWSDYNGTDADGDGVGQEPYLILTLHLDGEHYDADNYPVVDEFKIPEFPSWTPLLIITVALVVVAMIYRRRLSNQNQRGEN